MKILHCLRLLLLLVLGLSSKSAYAAFGIFESYVVINGTYYDLYATTGNTDFNGYNFGSFVTGSTLTFTGGEIKTYKEKGGTGCGSGNACGGTIIWAVKLSGSTVNSGSMGLNYNSAYGNPESGCSINQKWDNLAGSTNMLTGLTAGNYTLEVRTQSTGSQSSTSSCSDLVQQAALVASFTITAPLPVVLLNFEGKWTDRREVDLSWQTASEHQNSYFEVQRSADAVSWNTMEKIPSRNGNARFLQTYSCTDERPGAAKNYYRLRQVDTDGKESFSPVIQVRGGQKAAVVVSPNPAVETIWLQPVSGNEQPVSRVQVYDSFEKLLREWTFETNDASQAVSIDVSGLPSGVLLLRVDGQAAQRVVKY